jgi:subtilisin family serine protease
MPFARFDPPGFLEDFDSDARQRWSDWVSARLDEARNLTDQQAGLLNSGPRPQFFNPLHNPPDPDAVEKDITWTAFPRIVKIQSASDLQRWKRADSSRDLQDEYCEWSVTRDAKTGKIVRVTFTSEGPEYWEFLAQSDHERVLELYQQHISPEVRMEDLFRQSRYVARNKWNTNTTDGAMHLVQANNTLGAEIELAAASTLIRRRNDQILTGEQELISCGRYGQPERNSDPHIGAVVNEIARTDADVTLANPVGLCIAALSVAGWSTPDGSDSQGFWKIVRGTPDKALRAVYEVPEEKGFLVGDIKINGRNIEFGSQIADFITIKLTGLATRFGKNKSEPKGCVEPLPSKDFTAETVVSALRPSRLRTEPLKETSGAPVVIKQLDPALRRLVRKFRPAAAPQTVLVTAGGGEPSYAEPEEVPPIRVLVQFNSSEVPRRLFKVVEESKWHRVATGIYTVECPVDRLEQVAGDPDVRFIEGGRPMSPTLDTSVPETKADRLQKGGVLTPGALRGNSVVIGVIDEGFDYTLDDFRDTNGNSRIAFLWDQNLKPKRGEKSPKGFHYGVEYEKRDIDRALATSKPSSLIRHQFAEEAHGTHVLGIATGNGRSGDKNYPAGKYLGVAPDATIIVVQPGIDDGTETFTDAAHVADAIEYIFTRATGLGMPCVINMSLMQNGGSHDGESVVEHAIDRMLEEDRGRVFVVVAGNEHVWRSHASGQLSSGGKRQLHWRFGGPFPWQSSVPPGAYDHTRNEMEIWYSSRDIFTIRVIDPAGNSTRGVSTDQDDMGDFVLGNNKVHIETERFSELNGEGRVYIEVEKDSADLQSGTWLVEIEAVDIRDGRFDAWIERDRRDPANGFADQSFFEDPDFEDSMTLGTPATARRAIVVANYDHIKQVVHESSGRGLTRDQRHKPDVSAPGTDITSSCAFGGRVNAAGSIVAMRTKKTGTSMAAPHVTGIVALLFERAKQLNMIPPTAQQIRKILVASASNPSGSTAFDESWGYGRVDAEEALKLL